MKQTFTLLLILLASFSYANNIQLQKVSLADTNRTTKTVNIKMNISWEHSWRDSINWDAAWIIVKYKEPKDSIWKWRHAQLSQAGNNTGSATGVKIVVPNDRTGAFFYRSTIGSGNIGSENLKLVWNYGAAGVTNIDSVEVRVFATEMVYVPDGSFCLGDGDGNNYKSSNSFQLKNAPGNYAVITDKWGPLINTLDNYNGNSIDDQTLVNDGIRISGTSGIDINNDKVADYPNFPTGYKGFYCMKYKVTQGQYTDFLNTISVNDTTESLVSNYTVTSSPDFLKTVPKHMQAAWGGLGDFIYMFFFPQDKRRHTITFDSLELKFTVSRPDRAYALMDLNKSFSFSEWFALRPMSELEFEKACRGPLPPYSSQPYRTDHVWGADSAYPLPTYSNTTLTFSGVENGTEFFSDYDVSKRDLDPYNTTIANGDGGTGPYRVGIFATDTSTRISSGASYYGIMDLGKITHEIVVPISNSNFREFNYTSGKGVLSAFGKSYSFPKVDQVNNSVYRISTTSARGLNYTFLYGLHAVRIAPSDN
ncbi:MAG: hypothetical protein M3142_09400 [Bacteroidota bacterium]|nr:hypothetical protein [Bacteroidota bacterium]